MGIRNSQELFLISNDATLVELQFLTVYVISSLNVLTKNLQYTMSDLINQHYRNILDVIFIRKIAIKIAAFHLWRQMVQW